LKNVKEIVAEFEGRVNVEIKKQEKLKKEGKKDFRRGKLPEKYMAKILYGWNNRKFEEKNLKKLERNWQRWKSVSPKKKS